MQDKLAILVCLVSIACATPVTPVATLDPARNAAGPQSGIVVGRIETVNRDGRPATSVFGRPVRGPFTVRNVQSEIVYELERLDDSTASSDFYVELPSGDYFTFATQGCLGSFIDPEVVFVLSFTVQPGAVTYVGTLRSKVPTLAPPTCPSFTIADELAPLLERFAQRHPDLARDVRKSLLAARRLE